MKKAELKKVFPLLDLFSRLCEKDQVVLLKFLNCKGCEAILECVHNGMWNKDVDLKERKEISRQLMQHKRLFHFLNDKQQCPKKKQKKLSEVGGGIGLIVKSVLPIVASHLEEASNLEENA
jgi:hypothetical protein